MNCKQVHKEIFFYINGDIKPQKGSQVDEHLKGCSDCSEFLVYLTKSLDTIPVEKDIKRDPDFYNRINKELTKSQNPGLRSIYPLVRSVAAAAVIVFGTFSGINIARLSTGSTYDDLIIDEEYYYINDIYQEPIENFFLINGDSHEQD